MYRVRLTADGVTTEQSLRLRMDPTVHITQATLEAQHTLAVALNASLTRASVVAQALASIRSQVRQRSAAQGSAAVALAGTDSLAERLERGDASQTGVTGLASDVQQLYERIDGADAMPAEAQNGASKAQLARLTLLESGVTELGKVINRVTNRGRWESHVPAIVESGNRFVRLENSDTFDRCRSSPDLYDDLAASLTGVLAGVLSVPPQ